MEEIAEIIAKWTVNCIVSSVWTIQIWRVGIGQIQEEGKEDIKNMQSNEFWNYVGMNHF